MTIGSIGNYGSPYYNYGNYNNINMNNSASPASEYGKTKADMKLSGEDDKKVNGKSSPAECQTCKERKYVDGSNEADVSFKSAAHIAPQSAAARVRAHEGEHVSNAFSKAADKGGKVVSANVSIHTDVCPECGRTYVSGGTTTTQIKYPNESNPYQQNNKSADATKLRGANLDYTA